jgi:outer membrane protein assembly factor BamB
MRSIQLVYYMLCAGILTSCDISSTSNSLSNQSNYELPALIRAASTLKPAGGPLTLWDDQIVSYILSDKGGSSQLSLSNPSPLKTLWSATSSTTPYFHSTIYNDFIAFGGFGVVDLYSKNGKLVRRFTFPGEPPGYFPRRVVLNKRQIAFTFGYRFYIYDLDANGVPNEQPRLVLDARKEGLTGSPSAVADDAAGNLYVSWYRDTGHNLVSFDPTGTVRWKKLDTIPDVKPKTGAPVFISIVGNEMYTVVDGGGIHRLDLDGNEIWRNDSALVQTCGATILNDLPAFTDDGVFENCGLGSGVIALNRKDGSLRWAFNAPNKNTFWGTPMIHNGVVYAANGRMWALDERTGKALAVSEETDGYAHTTNPLYYPPTGEILLWGERLDTYKPWR